MALFIATFRTLDNFPGDLNDGAVDGPPNIQKQRKQLVIS